MLDLACLLIIVCIGGPLALSLLVAVLAIIGKLCELALKVILSPVMLVIWLHDKARGIKRRYY